MALVNVSKKSETGKARQFDGTLAAFLDILNAYPHPSTSATCGFDAGGAFTSLSMAWPQGSVTLQVSDWVVFNDDPTKPPLGLTNTAATAGWQIV